jgi:hypothetical protein
MAIPLYTVTNGTPFSSATGAKTALNILAGANQAVLLKSVTVSMDGVTSSAVPATVDVCQSTQGAAGTAGVTPTIVQASGRTLTAQATAGANYTAEPTTLTSIEKFYVPQFMGLFSYALPLGDEYETDFSGGTIKALAIRLNTSATVNVLVTARFWLVG